MLTQRYFSSLGYSLSSYLEHNLNIANLGFKLKTVHSLHHRNIKGLGIEMFKIHHGFSEVCFQDLFYNYNENNFYSFRSQLDTVQVRTIFWTSNL